MEENKTMLYASVIDSIAAFHCQQQRKHYQALAELLPTIARNSAESRERNRLQSRNLNVFRFFHPGETTHSRLLAYFLDPHESHGQSDLFLVEFLKLLEISQAESVSAYPWIVTAELGRVDVLIKRQQPHTVIVIENKSNFATDQPNQLYRYWYREIYLQQVERNASQLEMSNPSRNQFRVIYLSPDSSKQADEQSVCRPSAGYEAKPETVPKGIIEHQLFSGLVVQWLTNCLPLLPPLNHRLREFTAQYIEFWHSV